MDIDPQVRRALDELTADLPEVPDLVGALQRIAHAAQQLIPGCSAASITIRRQRGAAFTIASSDEAVLPLDEMQYTGNGGPCLSALDSDQVVWINDMQSELRWPLFTHEASSAGMRMTLSVPLHLGAEVVGVLNLYSTEEFTEESRDVATTLADHTGGTVRAATLYLDSRTLSENLLAAMDTRAVIEQAKGILMSQNRCTADEAFDLLARASMREGVKVRDVAQRIVASATD